MHILRALLVITVPALLVSAAGAEEAKLQTFEVGGIKVQAAPPAGWQVNEGQPVTMFDVDGPKGSISITGSAMPGTNADVFAMMHKAALDQGAARIKAGELKSSEEKSLHGFKGVLTLEAPKDPTMRRFQWTGYGHGGFFTIMMSSTGEAFDGYFPAFQKFLGSVKFAEK